MSKSRSHLLLPGFALALAVGGIALAVMEWSMRAGQVGPYGPGPCDHEACPRLWVIAALGQSAAVLFLGSLILGLTGGWIASKRRAGATATRTGAVGTLVLAAWLCGFLGTFLGHLYVWVPEGAGFVRGPSPAASVALPVQFIAFCFALGAMLAMTWRQTAAQ